MALIKFNNIGIKGIAAAVPKNVIHTLSYTNHFSAEEAKEIAEKTGIYERRFAIDGVCSSDLCFEAAEILFRDAKVDRNEIDLLIFISQTPDYRMPATSILLQERLQLSKKTAAFDISLGCSGYVYGLSVAYSLLQSGNFKNVLLLVGETRSRVYSPKDRRTAFLFGDGGTATLIGNTNTGYSWFSLNSDGSKSDYIKMDAGGYRQPSSALTIQEKIVDEYGNIRSDEHGYMNGADVFNFVISEIPNDVNSLLSFSGLSKEDIELFYFHQANIYMNDYLVKKMKIPKDKVPYCLDKFGNTSSVSIPLTMVSKANDFSFNHKRILLSGFGVGMSWGSAILNMSDCIVSNLVEI